jgi:hypothetical protein
MADGEFRIAGAFVEVNLKDNTAADEAKLRARLEKSTPVDFETALKDPGNVQAVKARISSGPAATIRTDADTALAQAKIKELSSRRNAAVVSLDADVSKAEARIKELESKRGKTKLDVDAEIGKAQAKIDALKAKKARILLEVDVDKNALAKASRDVDSETEKMAKRANAQFSAMQFVGAFAGLPAAAAVGAAGVSAALVGVPLLFAGIGAAALKGNEQVASAFSTTKTQVVDGTQQMAAVLAGPLANAAGDLGASFTRLKPQIQTAMTGSVPAVHTLTGAVTDFAESAMPGMVTAVKSSDAPLRGLRSLAGQAGTGVTEMFTNLSAGSQAAGTSLGTLGGVVRDAESFTGSLLAVLANGSTGTLPQFRATIGQLEGTILTLAHGAMPALQGASSGFMGTVGGLLGIVNAAGGALGSWTQPLGSLGGSLFATNSVAKLFGTSLGETSFGLKAFAATVDDAGNKTTPFKTAVSGAEGVMGKMKAGANSLLSAGINPLGIALVGGGLLLDAFGQAQQKAAEAAAAHRENVRTLTDAIRQDSGVLGANVQAVNAKALTDKNASTNLAAFGQTVGMATAAIQGNGVAYDTLKSSADATLSSIAKSAGASDEQAKAFGHLATTSLETGKNYGQLKSEADALLTTSSAMGDATVILDQAQRNQVDAIINGTGAVGEQIRSQREAHDAYILSESALTGLTTAQVENRDATVKATQALYDQQNQALGYRGAVLTTQDALTAYNKTLQGGTEAQKAKDLLAVERAFAAQEAAAYNAAYANNATLAPGQRVAEAMAAQDREAVKLANSLSGPLPESLRTTLGGLTLAGAAAAGMAVSVNNAGQAVYKLPNGKEIVITGNTKSAKDAINALPGIADKAGPGVFAVTANTDPATGKTNAAVQYADGSTGVIKIDGNRDKATGQTMVAVQFANGQTGFITVDAFNQAARDRTIEAKRNADGTVGWIVVKANTGEAESQANYAARTRYATIQFSSVTTGINSPDSYYRGPHAATGGLLTGGGVKYRGYAGGGLVQAFAGGGAVDVTAGGLMSGPGGPRGDGISAFSLSDNEFVVNAANTARNLDALIYANRGGAIAPVPPATRAMATADASIATPTPAAAKPAATTTTINQYITINGVEKSNPEIAAAMGAELNWQMRAR